MVYLVSDKSKARYVGLVRRQMSEKLKTNFDPLTITSAFEAFVLHAVTSATTP